LPLVQASAEPTLALAREHQQRGYQAYALRLLGDNAAHRDPPENALAESHYRQALTLADKLGMRPLVAHCHLGLGNISRKSGQLDKARAELSAAIKLYRAMQMTFWLLEAEGALAEVEDADHVW
jgi:sugar phosphate isomerase/epimerase